MFEARTVPSRYCVAYVVAGRIVSQDRRRGLFKPSPHRCFLLQSVLSTLICAVEPIAVLRGDRGREWLRVLIARKMELMISWGTWSRVLAEGESGRDMRGCDNIVLQELLYFW